MHRVSDGTNDVDRVLTVGITDVNEAPTFTNVATDGSTRTSIPENSATGTSIFTLVGTDQEGTAVTFTLVSPPSVFSITGAEIQVAGALDTETTATYAVTVR